MMKGKDILSIKELSREEIESVLDRAAQLQHHPVAQALQGVLLASCFFEPSTRTRLSFEAAVKRLGGDVIGFAQGDVTSQQKGESLSDMARVLGSYADVLVIRHPLEGAARCVAEATETPVINAGDGANEHPTQTLVDLFTIRTLQGRLDQLHIGVAGDLLYARTVHSLVYALGHFGCRLYAICPPSLPLPTHVGDVLKRKGIRLSYHETLEEVIDRLDVLYMTRIQKERFPSPEQYYAVQGLLRIHPELLARAQPHLKVLHPLPRVGEIDRRVDSLPQAAYFTQASWGIYVRQALLTLLLGK